MPEDSDAGAMVGVDLRRALRDDRNLLPAELRDSSLSFVFKVIDGEAARRLAEFESCRADLAQAVDSLQELLSSHATDRTSWLWEHSLTMYARVFATGRRSRDAAAMLRAVFTDEQTVLHQQLMDERNHSVAHPVDRSERIEVTVAVVDPAKSAVRALRGVGIVRLRQVTVAGSRAAAVLDHMRAACSILEREIDRLLTILETALASGALEDLYELPDLQVTVPPTGVRDL